MIRSLNSFMLLIISVFLCRHFSGVGPYDKVAIISNNRFEWAVIASAAYSLNATIVPMYEAQLPTVSPNGLFCPQFS
jgi:hypothetical protein